MSGGFRLCLYLYDGILSRSSLLVTLLLHHINHQLFPKCRQCGLDLLNSTFVPKRQQPVNQSGGQVQHTGEIGLFLPGIQQGVVQSHLSGRHDWQH